MNRETVSYHTTSSPITQAEYQAFQDAYDFFNRELFDGGLPQLLVTLQRKARSKGYFAAERFDGRLSNTAVHELALNPDNFTGRTDIEILSTLVHEMVHAWQETHGTPSRRGYHNQEWAAKMKAVGLYPSDTGLPGGKETGQSMTHYIIPEGAFAQTYARLQATGLCLHWQSSQRNGQARNQSKTKYTCPACGLNAWARPSAHLVCSDCEKPMEQERA
jgi:predicted SprT family Zn-dependent metalloprotease